MLTTRWRWYLARLRAMSVGEIAFRVRRASTTLAEDRLWRAVPTTWERAWRPPLGHIVDGSEPGAPRGPLDPQRVRAAAEACPGEAADAVAAAAAFESGRARFLSYPPGPVPLGVVVRDPVTGRSWPDVHGKLLDYRTAAAGDPKWVWEVNRLQHLPLLVLAGQATGDDAFAAAAAERAVAWARAARPPYGIPWSNGFEAGLRAISLALVLDGLRGTSHLDGEGRADLLRSLWQHARWIQRDPSLGSSANNHLIGEAVGLLTIGLLAPELRDSSRFVEDGRGRVEREAAAQVLPDGASAEQAFAYHLFVCDLLLLVVSLLRSCGAEPPAPVVDALARSGDAIAAQVASGEPEPAYGDADDGRAFLFDGSEVRTAGGVSASIACAVGRRAAADLAGTPDLTARVLFGADGARRFASAEGPPAASSAVLRDAGLVVLRGSGVRVIFDAGSIGYLGIAAHGHADALSLVVSEGADELVSDPGTGTYFGDATRRHMFRGTASHPTVTLGGADQARYGGPFLWLHHPDVRLLDVDLGRRAAVGEVTYEIANTSVRHRRSVMLLSSGDVLVYDRIDGGGPHDAVLAWPLHPAVEAVRRGERFVEGRVDGRPRLLMAVAAAAGDGTANVELMLGEGEWSRRLDRVEPTAVVRALLPCAAPVEAVTLLVVARGRVLADPQLELSRDSERAVASFALDGAQRVVFDGDAMPVEAAGAV